MKKEFDALTLEEKAIMLCNMYDGDVKDVIEELLAELKMSMYSVQRMAKELKQDETWTSQTTSQ